MIDNHQFLQAKCPAMVHQEHQVILQKWHNDNQAWYLELLLKLSCKQ